MPLSVAAAAAKTTAISTAFNAIGNAGDTAMPRCRRNIEAAAWEYFVASLALRIAEARRKKAITGAVTAGVMFDPAETPRPVGTEALVYAGDVVEIGLSVTTATTALDLPAFLDALEKGGSEHARQPRAAQIHRNADHGVAPRPCPAARP
jgi:hypothetical protein